MTSGSSAVDVGEGSGVGVGAGGGAGGLGEELTAGLVGLAVGVLVQAASVRARQTAVMGASARVVPPR